MKRVLITGANSYVGTSVENYLRNWPKDYFIETVSMLNTSWKNQSFSTFDTVFHVAGIAHQDTRKLTKEKEQLYYRINTELVIETARKAKAEGVKQFIFMSSIIVYGLGGKMGENKVITRETRPNPIGAYGDSKLQAEKGLWAMRDDYFTVCVLRSPMIYGEGSKGNYALLEKAAEFMPIFPNIENQRSMLSIERLSQFVKRLIDTGKGGVYFPQDASYKCTSQLVKEIGATKGRKIRLVNVFNPLLKCMSGRVNIIDKVFGNLVYDTALGEEGINIDDINM